MAISFIPNQPILFEDPLFADQSCLNNDTRAYAQLAQAGDNTCIQFINEPVAVVNDCNLTNNTDVVINGGFNSDLSNWTEYDFTSGVPTGGGTWTWSEKGATSNPAAVNIGLFQPLGGIIGNIYMISFEFEYDNGGNFIIALGNQATNSWNGPTLYNNFETNIDGRRCLIISSYLGTDLAFWTNTADVKIKNIEARDITYCQLVVPNSSLNYWTYVESVNGWQKLDGTSAVLHPLTLSATLQNGKKYRLRYKITNMTEDGIAYFEIQDHDNNTIIKQYANGEFVEYFTYSGTNGYSYLLGDSNAFGGVIYDIVFEEMCYNHTISITYPDGSPASISYDSTSPVNPITYYADRMIWCFDWDTLESFDVPGAPLSSDCYTVTVDDNGCGGTTHQSNTIINYKATGSHDCSVVVRGSNQGYAYGFYFNAIDSNVYFTLKQRLRILQFNPLYPVKTEQYLFSNGTMSRPFAQSGKVRTAWFDYVDEATHDVIRLQLLSDTLIIDDKPFFCIAEDYEPEWGENGKYNLAQSKVVLMAQNEPTLYNKNCL